ncbi:hypothetical protein BHU61_04240 [Macrococcus epidermidis]|uniref:Uncharacterized protein n=1 Tax=Macrococcus epidermidis TaxID=1902580 RepID=A0A327ZWY7_9STAP|nr:hypothetical protein [Macrococcus epidermidis]RAK46677.1 hypothetical protein BHU61_04240 [Macrococcus epidermidis]
MSSENGQNQEGNKTINKNEITVTFNKKHLGWVIFFIALSPLAVALGITWPKELFGHTSADANSWLQFWGSMLGGFIGTIAVIYVAHLQNTKQEQIMRETFEEQRKLNEEQQEEQRKLNKEQQEEQRKLNKEQQEEQRKLNQKSLDTQIALKFDTKKVELTKFKFDTYQSLSDLINEYGNIYNNYSNMCSDILDYLSQYDTQKYNININQLKEYKNRCISERNRMSFSYNRLNILVKVAFSEEEIQIEEPYGNIINLLDTIIVTETIDKKAVNEEEVKLIVNNETTYKDLKNCNLIIGGFLSLYIEYYFNDVQLKEKEQ